MTAPLTRYFLSASNGFTEAFSQEATVGKDGYWVKSSDCAKVEAQRDALLLALEKAISGWAERDLRREDMELIEDLWQKNLSREALAAWKALNRGG